MSGDPPNSFLFEASSEGVDEIQDWNRDVTRVSALLGQPETFTDEAGYEISIDAAAIHPTLPLVAHVECRIKNLGQWTDVSYNLYLREEGGRQADWEVETYNPYFGCEVQFLRWHGRTVILIYREKHHVYVARFGLDHPAERKMLADDWVMKNGQIGYWRYNETRIRRLELPSMAELPSLSEEEAAAQRLLPSKCW